ncbi:MAG: hypothetical protein ACTSRU_21395, partial [Candidatus Hodarchaeales archaeon]
GTDKQGGLVTDLNNLVNENLGIIRSALEKFNEDSRSLLRSLIEDHVNKARESLNSYRDKINQRIQEISSLKINLQKAQVELINASGEVNDRIEEEVNQVLDKSKEIMSKDYDNVLKMLENNKTTVEGLFDKEKEQLLFEIDSTVSSIDSELETSLETINTAIDGAKKDLNAINNLIDGQQGKISEVNEGIVNTLGEIEKKFKQELSNSEKGVKNVFKEKISPVLDKGNSLVEEAKKKFTSSNDVLSRQLIEQFESFSGSGQVLIGTFQESVSQTLKKHDDDIEKAITGHESKVSAETETIAKDIGESLDNTKKFIAEVFNSQIENFKTLETDITTEFSSKIDSKASDVEKSLTDLSEEIDQKNTQILQDIPDDLELFKTDHVAKLEQFEREIRGKLNNILTLVEEMNEALSVKKFKDKERKIFAEKLSEAKLELGPAAAKFSSLIRDQMTSFGDQIDDNLDKFTTTLQKLNEDSRKSLQGNIEDFGKTVDSLKSEINSTVVSSMNKAVDLLTKEQVASSEKIDGINSTVTSKVKQISEQMGTVTGELVNNSRAATENALAEIDTHIEGLLSAYSSVSEQAVGEVNQTTSSQSEAIIGTLDDVIKSTGEVFRETESEISKTLESTNKKMNQTIEDSIKDFKAKITEFDTQIK